MKPPMLLGPQSENCHDEQIGKRILGRSIHAITVAVVFSVAAMAQSNKAEGNKTFAPDKMDTVLYGVA